MSDRLHIIFILLTTTLRFCKINCVFTMIFHKYKLFDNSFRFLCEHRSLVKKFKYLFIFIINSYNPKC